MTEVELTEWAARIGAEIVQRGATVPASSGVDRDGAGIRAENGILTTAISEALVSAYRAGFEDGCKIRKNPCHI